MVNLRSHALLLPLLIALLLIVAGCASAEQDTPTEAPPTATATPAEPTATTEAAAPLPPPPTLTPAQDSAADAPTLNPPVEALPKGGYSCEDYPCPEDADGWESKVRVPDGFIAEHLTVIPDLPTSITFGPDGLLYAAVMTGTIHTVDADGTVGVAWQGLNTPVGIAFQPDSNKLYVSDRVSNEEARVGYIDFDAMEYVQLFDGVPCCYAGMHAANGLEFGPDGMLYVAVGAMADHGEVLNTDEQAELHPWEASILRVSPDGSSIEPFARGLRNAYDIAWDANGNLFATNNGPDFGPPDTIYLVQPGGEHGYPWYECDNCFGPAPDDVELIPPMHEFIPHSAPTGVVAYAGAQFPSDYANNTFAVLWSAFEGAQKVVRFASAETINPDGTLPSTDWMTGLAAPIDITVGPDGAMYVVDWATGVLIKITYEGG